MNEWLQVVFVNKKKNDKEGRKLAISVLPPIPPSDNCKVEINFNNHLSSSVGPSSTAGGVALAPSLPLFTPPIKTATV